MDPNLVNIVQLKDVSYVSALADRHILMYNNAAASKKWENKPISDIAAQSIGGGIEKVLKATASTATYALNITDANVLEITLNVNVTFTLPTTPVNTACSFTLYIKQGASARTVTWPGSAKLKWAGGSAPTVTATAGAVDIFVFETIDGGTTWYGSLVGKNFR
jgi:hypothetical protein